MTRRSLLGVLAILCTVLLLGPATPVLAAGRATDGSWQPDGRKGPDRTRAFTIAVVPDTQMEVLRDDGRITGRNRWLVANRESLDLRYVAQVGDLTNWGWLAPAQLTRASDAFGLLEDAGVPYSVAVGNHDTRAVGWNGRGGYGGSAYVDNPECVRRFSEAECRSRLLLRHTEAVNGVFDRSRFGAVRGAFEAGKIDNVWSTFRAGGLSWLVLDLEIWPRASVVAWADKVIENNPRSNVIVNTHAWTSGRDRLPVEADNGDTAPKALWSKLVSRHPNVFMVLSGHAGRFGTRVDTGAGGNKVVSFRQTYPRGDGNPVRLVTIDPRSGTVRSDLYSPQTRQWFRGEAGTYRGFGFVG